jgi:hypothetical protein
VGAVVTRGTTIVAEGRNRMRSVNDPTAHAEMVALRTAAAALGTSRLDDCSLWVSLEPLRHVRRGDRARAGQGAALRRRGPQGRGGGPWTAAVRAADLSHRAALGSSAAKRSSLTARARSPRRTWRKAPGLPQAALVEPTGASAAAAVRARPFRRARWGHALRASDCGLPRRSCFRGSPLRHRHLPRPCRFGSKVECAAHGGREAGSPWLPLALIPYCVESVVAGCCCGAGEADGLLAAGGAGALARAARRDANLGTGMVAWPLPTSMRPGLDLELGVPARLSDHAFLADCNAGACAAGSD